MKDTFFKSTIILLLGGAIVKFLGMFIKIIMNRIIGIEAMSLYMLVFPTFTLGLTISQIGIPSAIIKLVSENTHNNKKIMQSIIPISIIYNLLIFTIFILLSKIIAYFLNDTRTIIPIISIAFTLPFDSISNILRSYYYGKEKMFIATLSLLVEQLVRLSLIVFLIPSILDKGIEITVSSLILINIISELSSIILLITLIKNKNISLKDFKIDKKEIKSIMRIALPTTGSRLIGGIAYFLEPIIITTLLLKNGYSKDYIIEEYGIIEGYVLPILLLPSFLTNALSCIIIPDISKKYGKKEFNNIKKRIRQVIKITLFIGITSLTIIYINKNILLELLYETNKGSNYIKILIPFFILHYLETSLESILQAIDKAKTIMKNNIIGITSKILILIILSYLNIGLYNLIIAIIININITTILHINAIKKELAKLHIV